MLNYIKSLCGVYVTRRPSSTSSAAVRYEVSLGMNEDRQALHWKTECGDGSVTEDSFPIEDLGEDEKLRFDLTLPVLDRLKVDWDFSPANSGIEIPPARIFTFDLKAEVDRFFSNASISAGGEPEIVILAGGVCCGKSTRRREHFADHVQIDAGDVFINLSRDEYFDFGSTFEEPLETVGQAIARRAVHERRNIVTEIIGADAGETKGLLSAIVAGGYQPKLEVLHCDIEIAAERNLSRGYNISAHYCEPYHVRWITEAMIAEPLVGNANATTFTG
jgi:hypothetical protein